MTVPILSVYDAQGNEIPIPAIQGKKGETGNTGAQGLPGSPGIDGVSPEVTVEQITGGHTVKITDKQHPTGQTFNVMDGSDAEVTAENIESALGYEPANPSLYRTSEEQDIIDNTHVTRAELASTNRKFKWLNGLTNGQTWDIEDGTSPAYAQNIPAGAKAVSINGFGGKSVAWNQIVSGIYDRLTNLAVIPSGQKLLLNHKYYGKANATFTLFVRDTTNIAVGTFNSGKGIITSGYNAISTGEPSDRTDGNFWAYMNEPNVFDYCYIVDLTQMFGTDNEPATTDDPRITMIEAYLAENPEYNEGEIVSAEVTDVKSVGFNLWDEEWEVGGIDWTTGGNSSETDRIRSKNHIKVNGGTMYYFSPEYIKYMWFYDAGKNIIQGVSGNDNFIQFQPAIHSFTTPSNCAYIRFIMWTTYGTTYNNDICINIFNNDLNGQYRPYIGTDGTLSIPPALLTFLSDKGYGWSAGSVYNEVDFERKKYVQRVGSAELDDTSIINSWYALADRTHIFQNMNAAATLGAKFSVDVYTTANILCDQYPTKTYERVYNDTDGISGLNSNGRIYVCDNSVSDITAFKAKIAGVQIFYELAEPVEYDISAYLEDGFNLLPVEGGGSLTFVQSDAELSIPNDTTYAINLLDAIL